MQRIVLNGALALVTMLAARLLQGFWWRSPARRLSLLNQTSHSRVSDLAADLEGPMHKGARLISIDGIDGSGKTTLAEGLSGLLNAEVVQIDDFLQKNQGDYLAHIRYEDLSRHLSGLLKHSKLVIFEGCCVLSVLRRLSCSADLTVYCKKLDRHGLWVDGHFLSEWTSAEEYIQHLRDIQRKMTLLEDTPATDDLPGLEIDIITYHFEYRPDRIARFIFQRSAPD